MSEVDEMSEEQWDEDKLAIWTSRVTAEHRKVSNARAERKNREAKKLLTASGEQIGQKVVQRFAAAVGLPLARHISIPNGVAAAHKFTVRNIRLNEIQRIRPVLIPDSVASFPVLHSYQRIDRNILKEDEMLLQNIPYLGDNVDDNFEFLTDLVKNYELGVHGGGGGLSKPQGIGSEVAFVELVRRLWELEKADMRAQNSGVSYTPPSMPGRIIFAALCKMFPDEGSVDKLMDKFAKYEEMRLNDQCVQSPISEPFVDYSVPSIDDSAATSTGRDEIIHSFRTLVCRRCFLYECTLHGVTDHIVPLARKKRKILSAAKSRLPCGPNCYLSELQKLKPELFDVATSDDSNQSDASKSSSSGRKSHKKKVNLGGIDIDSNGDSNSSRNSPIPSEMVVVEGWETGHWSPADETYFRVLNATVSHTYCSIAKTLHKSCRQVYAFACADVSKTPADELLSEPESPGQGKTRKKKLTTVWAPHSQKFKDENGGNEHLASYYPCHHPNQSCDEANCACVRDGTFCERFCGCSPKCANRFPGCRCRAHCSTKSCPCFLAIRECDPLLCKTCGADDFDSNQIKCHNVSIQRGLKQRLLLAPSDVAGWGIFVKDAVAKHKFIAEYCGEMITQDEAEKRGKLYDMIKCSFLFNLNQDFAIDATRKGNKIRFANHSSKPNCYAKVLMVNGNHRIGIFANENIKEGAELFFDYRYGPQDQLKFVSIERS